MIRRWLSCSSLPCSSFITSKTGSFFGTMKQHTFVYFMDHEETHFRVVDSLSCLTYSVLIHILRQQLKLKLCC